MSACRHLVISGRVQGVGYRAWTVREAQSLGIHGWVRNRTDGTVEAVIEGPEHALDKLVESAYEGPMMAAVTDIAVNDCEPENFRGFEARETV